MGAAADVDACGSLARPVIGVAAVVANAEAAAGLLREASTAASFAKAR
jgi:hypothetical protein